MEEHVYPGDKPPSRLRGWFRSFIGAITFNRRKRVEGKIERQDAKAYHQAMRIRKHQKQHRERSRSRHRSSSKAYHRSSSRRRHRSSRIPFLHFRRRAHPPYHGAHYRFWGFLTRNRDHQARGLAMKEDADRGRRRERRRRLRWLQQEGQAIRMGAATLFRGPKHRSHHQHSSRRRHHSSHRHRSAGPQVIVSPDAAPPAVYADGQPVPVQVARSMGNGHGHHRHHSANGYHTPRSIPVSATRSHSRHRSMSQGGPTEVMVTPRAQASHLGMPIAPTVHSHRESAIPVQRSAVGHSARQFYEDLGPSHPGSARTSSSRHRSTSGSYYGRHRTHTSHTPSIIQVTA